MTPVRNLLIVLPRGLRSDALSDDRSWPLQTPCLEKLGQRGLRVAAASAGPTEGTGLTSLLSGLHPRQHGLLDGPTPPLVDALPRWLAQVGYHVAGVGCIDPIADQLHDRVRVADVDQTAPHECAYWSAMVAKGLAPALSEQRAQRQRGGPFEPERLLMEPEDDIDGFIGREAAAMMDRLPSDRPWALFVMPSGPGNDIPPPTLYESVVSASSLRGGFTPADLRQVDALAEPAYPRALLQRLEPHTIARIRSDYLGRVSLIDFIVNRLVRALDKRADRDRTWTVISSDRGHLLGEHGLVGARSFLAGALEVPLIVAPPEEVLRQTREAHEANDQTEHILEGLVSTVDVAPTIGAIGSCDCPETLPGRSLLPMLVGDGDVPEPAGGNLSEFGDRMCLETERFKVVYDRASRHCLGLFDLLHDPEERTELVDTPRGQNLVDALRWRVADALMPLRAAHGVFGGC